MTALSLERLHIRRMPGILSGFELDALSPGLNVVYGPNSSGKTTTASAIESLLWPRTAPDLASVSARLRLDGGDWLVSLDARQASWQKDGHDAPAVALPAAEIRDRYRLALPELLTGSDGAFARAVSFESAGGYDLAAASAALGPRTTASRCAAEQAALRQARQHLDEARALQESLHRTEQELRELDEKLSGRDALLARLRLLDMAMQHAEAREAEVLAAQRLARFDPRMARLLGNEAEQARRIAEKLAELRRDEQTAANDEQRAQSSRAQCRLPDSGLPPELLPALRYELDRLREQERSIAAAEQALREADVRRERERVALGSAVDAEQLRGLDPDGTETLAKFAQAAEKLAAHKAALEAQLENLQPGSALPRDPEALNRGVFFLRKWLQSGARGDPAHRRLRTLGILSAAGLTLAGLTLAVAHPALAVTALIGVVLLILILRPGAALDARAMYQAEFGKLTIRGPVDWSVAAVEGRLTELEGDLASARLAAERALQRQEVANHLASLRPQERKLEDERARILARLGLDPHLSNGSLVWMIERIGRWYDADVAAESATGALNTARAQLSAGLAAAAARVAAHTAAELTGVPALAGVLAELERRQKQFEGSSAQLATAREKLAATTQAIASLLQERAEILERAGLESDEIARLDLWCADHTEFRVANEAHRLAVGKRDDLAARLAEMEGFDANLLLADETALSERHARDSGRESELQEMGIRATEIRTRIKDAKRGHAIEDALAEVTRCDDALRAAREKDARAMIAAALVDFVQERTRDQHLPLVFHRAREIFTQITRGRYHLDFEDGDTPAFRAVDTITRAGHPLGELSSGSRVQLLLAIRLAFVETQEQGIQLPLLLDETLGNSDDERAQAIMEALLALAEGGRQLFYFTAQPDEVGKWRGLLQSREEEIPHAFIDLASTRRLARRVAIQGLRVVGAPQRVVPDAGGMSHDEYGAALRVPVLDPFAPPEAAHLWYLVENPAALHELLAEVGVEELGAFRALTECGAGELVEAELRARIQARGRALAAALEALRIGRGRPVDRAALQASQLLSATFLNPVADLCVRHGGDAASVLSALESGEVKHFQARTREKLRDFLDEQGYLDSRDPLDAAEVRARTLASVTDEIGRGVIEVGDVDRLLERVESSLSVPVSTL